MQVGGVYEVGIEVGGKRAIAFSVQRPEWCICVKFFVLDGLERYRFCIFKAGIEVLAEIVKLFFSVQNIHSAIRRFQQWDLHNCFG